MQLEARRARRWRAVALPGLLFLAGCAADAADTGALRGRVLPEPVARPAFELPDANGNTYDFARQTQGKLTFLFFGYTYCPDICPVHMATLAAALQELPYEQRQRVEVVFVTVDPERDTPERLRQWLGDFDPGFVGLRGTLEQANAAAALVGLPPSSLGEGENYGVGHPAGMLAFSPDGPARVLYPFGTRREDWAHDLPLLLGRGGGARAVAASASREAAGRAAPAAGIEIARAYITPPRSGGTAALYAVLANGSAAADALVGLDAPAARSELHETVHEGEGAGMRMQMRVVESIELPAGGTVRLEPGGRHAMIMGAAYPWGPGDSVTVRFRFRSGTVRTVHAAVVRHEEVARLLGEDR